MSETLTYMTPKRVRTLTKDPLALLLASSARAEVLRLFLLDPSRAYYQRQIETVTGLAIRAVQRELDRLTEIGLLYRREEGNRAYYHVDTAHLVFSDLRGLVLKTAPTLDRLRASLTMEPSVRQAFLNATGDRVLIVTTINGQAKLPVLENTEFDVMTNDAFVHALETAPDQVRAFLQEGVDLLGRRDDVLWRRIEAAGFAVKKARGVA